MKKYFYQILHWILAIGCAVLIMNLIMFVYNREPGWIDRVSGATLSIWNPDSFIVRGTEGYGIHHVDERGYLNPDLPISEKYILAVGSSYTQGKEVMYGYRYTDILNDMLSDDSEQLCVYNVSQDGLWFPEIVQGFSALVQEFPNAQTIVLEIYNTDFSQEDLETALEQRTYDTSQNGENIKQNLSIKKRVNIFIKEFFPIVRNLKKQMTMLKERTTNKSKPTEVVYTEPISAAKGGTDTAKDQKKYKQRISKALELLTDKYNGKIIILYHPRVQLEKDGSMTAILSESDVYFQEACFEHKIECVDATDAFLKNYREKNIVPYGFANTQPGTGHLNVAGHQIIADLLYQAIMRRTVK